MDTNERLEPLAVDVRSPGERMSAGGRAGIGRLGELLDDQPFGVAGLIWMLGTLTVLGGRIYSVVDVTSDTTFSGGATWNKITLLAQTGGQLVAVSCIVGIALAVASDSTPARFALWLAAAGGGWVFVAGALGIASALHASDDGGITYLYFGGTNRAVSVISELAYAGLGLVAALIAWRLARRRPAAPDLS